MARRGDRESVHTLDVHMDSHLGLTSTAHIVHDLTFPEAGKRRRLSRLADSDGRFSMLAVDQRTSLKKMLGEGLDTAGQSQALQLVKRVVASHIAPQATALLLDPIYGYPHALESMPAGVGLILAVEVSGYERVGGVERRSHLLDDFAVSDAVTAGADAVKLLIWHHPDVSEETGRHQRAIVRSVGEECRAAGVPFILEIVTYGLGESTSSPEYLRQKPAFVLDGVRTYSDPEYGVDLFKVQFPADLKHADAFQDARFAAGTVLFTMEEVEASCREIDRAASAPWVILSAGVEPDEFIENVKIANDAGASGFLCGRAVWKKLVDYLPDEPSMQDFARDHACRQFIKIRDANASARPWHERLTHATAQ